MTTCALFRRTRVRKIYIDCTSTHRHDVNTGIQRMTRNIVNTAPAVGSKLGIVCQGVAFDRWRGFRPVGPLPVPAARAAGGAAAGMGVKSRLKSVLRAVRFLAPLLWIKHCLEAARDIVARVARTLLPPIIRFGDGDVIVLPDGTWAPDFSWDALEAAQKRGALVGLVVHDLIPIQHPPWTTFKPSIDRTRESFPCRPPGCRASGSVPSSTD
jgi:hypothetical protein